MENQKIKFNFVFLGQSVLKYQVPLDIFYAINQIYEQNFHNLAPANGQLVGKIENEHSLFYHGADQTKMKNHNMLPRDVTNYFFEIFNVMGQLQSLQRIRKSGELEQSYQEKEQIEQHGKPKV